MRQRAQRLRKEKEKEEGSVKREEERIGLGRPYNGQAVQTSSRRQRKKDSEKKEGAFPSGKGHLLFNPQKT